MTEEIKRYTQAENGMKTLEKFLRDVRGKRKEMASKAGDGQVELA